MFLTSLRFLDLLNRLDLLDPTGLRSYRIRRYLVLENLDFLDLKDSVDLTYMLARPY